MWFVKKNNKYYSGKTTEFSNLVAFSVQWEMLYYLGNGI